MVGTRQCRVRWWRTGRCLVVSAIGGKMSKVSRAKSAGSTAREFPHTSPFWWNVLNEVMTGARLCQAQPSTPHPPPSVARPAPQPSFTVIPDPSGQQSDLTSIHCVVCYRHPLPSSADCLSIFAHHLAVFLWLHAGITPITTACEQSFTTACPSSLHISHWCILDSTLTLGVHDSSTLVS